MAYVNYTHTYYQMQALPRFFSTAAVLQICAQLLDCRSINLLASVAYVCTKYVPVFTYTKFCMLRLTGWLTNTSLISLQVGLLTMSIIIKGLVGGKEGTCSLITRDTITLFVAHNCWRCCHLLPLLFLSVIKGISNTISSIESVCMYLILQVRCSWWTDSLKVPFSRSAWKW